MRKLALVSLAALAAAALPAAASAQPRAGHSWGQGGQQGQRVIVRHGGPGAGMQHGDRRDSRHIRRFDRGHFVPQFWWGPQFQVNRWQMYGFPQPMPGHRWVRYYDDAYMIDGRGRVHEGRYGLDWDRYGDRWSRDETGIPMYDGDGDWQPGARDHEYAEEGYQHRGRGGGWDYSEYGPGPASSCAPRRRGPCGGPAPHPGPSGGYGYGGGYGAGYGYGAAYGYVCCATVTITETIVETGGSSYSEEVVEEEVVRQRVRRPACCRPAPRPRRPVRGERG
ncbi:MAG TPA: RcnB family protein [Allosphingosinicella sp.]|nr:RcnB family protein [Allosphingosinicella sp.]